MVMGGHGRDALEYSKVTAIKQQYGLIYWTDAIFLY